MAQEVETSIQPDLETLKSLINASLWTLHLSQVLGQTDGSAPTNIESGSGRASKAYPKSDLTPSTAGSGACAVPKSATQATAWHRNQATQESIEQVYASSLDENSRKSAKIADSIVNELVLGNGSPFREFSFFFHKSDSNAKKGFGVLAGKIEEKILNLPSTHFLSQCLAEIKKIITESQNSQVSFDRYKITIQEMIDKYGLLIVSMHAQTLGELLNSGDQAEFKKQKAFIDKAFLVYAELQNVYGTGKAETPADVYGKAVKAYKAKSYSEAINLFNQVISMDSTYASQNGCYWYIGICYRDWSSPDQAVNSFKDSIRYDVTKPYKRESFYEGVTIYLNIQTDASYTKAIAYLKDVYAMPPPDDYISQSVWCEMGRFCMRVDEFLPDLLLPRRAEYFKEGVDAYCHQLDYYKPVADLEEWKKPDNTQVQLGNAYYRLAKVPLSGISAVDQELYLNKAIEIYRKNIVEYPKPPSATSGAITTETVRSYIADSFKCLGDISDLSREKRISYYEQGGEEYLKMTGDYPDSVYAPKYYWGAGDIYSMSIQSVLDKFEDKDKFSLKAITAYKDSLIKYPDYSSNDAILISLARCYDNLGNNYGNNGMPYRREYLLQAVDTYDRYISGYPAGGQLLQCISQAAFDLRYVALTYQNEKDMVNAEKYYLSGIDHWKKILAMAGINDRYKIQAQYRIGENYKLLSDAFRKITHDSENQRKYGQLGIDELTKVFDYSTSIYGSSTFRSSSLRYCGEIYLWLEEYATAITYFDRGIVEYPKSADFPYYHLGKGDALYGLKSYTEAEDWYNKVLGLDVSSSFKPYFNCRAELGLGKCELALNKIQTAHQHLAEAVRVYCIGVTIEDGDDYALEAKDLIVKKILRVIIDPMTDTIAQGEPVNFTAKLVYMDDDSHEAQVPASAIKEWKWEESGNEGDGHIFASTETNTATYTGGTGDFQDTILTAKCRLNAGIFGTRSVTPEIWVEGDNQVPICLVNEDGKRIKFAPVFINHSAKGMGLPPNYGAPVKTTLKFATDYSDDATDEIILIPWNPNATEEIRLSFTETSPSSRHFVNEAGTLELEVLSPSPDDRFSGKKPGEELLNGNLIAFGEKIPLKLPLWLGPGIGSDKVSKSVKYEASNSFIDFSNAADLDQTQFMNDNTIFQIEVTSPVEEGDSISLRFKTNVYDSDEVICDRISKSKFRSGKLLLASDSHPSDQSSIKGGMIVPVKTGDESRMNLLELIFGQKIRRILIKLPTLLVCAYNPNIVEADFINNAINLVYFESIFGQIFTSKEGIWSAQIKLLENELRKTNNVTVCYTPTPAQFKDASLRNYLSLKDFDKIIIAGHGYGTIAGIAMYPDERIYDTYWSYRDCYLAPKEVKPNLGNNHPRVVILSACWSAKGIHGLDNASSWINAFNNPDVFVGSDGELNALDAEEVFTQLFKLANQNWIDHNKGMLFSELLDLSILTEWPSLIDCPLVRIGDCLIPY
ncbi:MAG: tetratricopeptide repeat protein [Candidatus Wallbacteria bacterium]|nr:tetratricopeptide repeat protein [Candidatus Wallbacteria bacterium]